ncbi:hypothetical protein [Cognatishimia sp. F0-27]|uniref:hypothetical protein n=1 Tax=Cognatishimia sp. F0-27 TaxID=2816855 RepID=UPI001D0CA595|nr:hypothetical protein [Cognatishimia sp. F0-27]MCC1494596.1 hypothetical protein [Cognatishimia sp. F0-27]
MTRLVLHGGDCKSGSTAIQSVLQLGSWRYSGETMLKLAYAQGGRREGLNHQRLADSLHMKKAMSYRETAWANLGKDFTESDADVMVISAERFEFAPPEAVRAALEEFVPDAMQDLRVILYVRPHAARLLSGYAQNVQQRIFKDDLPAFLEQMSTEERFIYAPRLLRWKETFGDALEIRPMVRDMLFENCVVHDFLSFCAEGTSAVPVVEKIPRENASLNPHGLELIRQMALALQKRNPAPNPQHAQIMERLGHNLERIPSFSGGGIQLPDSMRADVRAAFMADADRCDKELFGTPVMVPQLERALAKPFDPSAVPTAEEIDRLKDLSLVWLDMLGRVLQQAAAGRKQGAPGAQPGRPQIRQN